MEDYRFYPNVFGDLCAMYIAEYKNTSDVPIRLSNISFDIEKPDGTLLKTVSLLTSMPRSLAPGETGYICDQVADSGIDKIDSDALRSSRARLHYSISESNYSAPKVVLSQVTLKDTYGHAGIMGKVKNAGAEQITSISIAAAIRDEDGKLLTVALGSVSDIAAGAEKGFEGVAFAGDPDADYTNATVTAFAYE